MTRAPILLSVLAASCAPDVPSTPSYQQHVAPILAANCVRCHGVPVLGGAPAEFRLDAFADSEVLASNGTDTVTVSGAATYSNIIAMRVADDDRPMPPRFRIDDYQIETLEKWDAAGAPRGEPNSGNRPPTAEIVNIEKSLVEEGIETRVRYLIDVVVRDPDPDIVGGSLRATLGATSLSIGLLRNGPNRITWDTTNLARATYGLEATLDDGGVEVGASLGNLDVEGP